MGSQRCVNERGRASGAICRRTLARIVCLPYMRPSKQKQLDEQRAAKHSALAKVLAPEDIRPGDFVTKLHASTELPSFLWCADASTLPLHEPIRFQFIPVGAGIPLKVKCVCLPFVLVKRPFGDARTLDVRQCRLARLDREYAAAAWKEYRKAKSKRRRN